MKIFERYSVAEKIFNGKGLWALFLPLRYILAFIYGIVTKRDRIYSPDNRESAASDRAGHTDTSPYVISVGNIVVGGGGKTPCAISLAELIREKGGFPVVVSRGYRSLAEKKRAPVILGSDFHTGGSNEECLGIEDFTDDPEGMSFREFARAFGDEVAIYRNRGFSVIIDTDRSRGIRAASRVLGATDIILDDAYQNLSVSKDLDLLLLDHSKPFADGRLLPMGRLREDPAAAVRADAIIFTRAISGEIPETAREYTKGKKVFFSRHEFDCVYGKDGSRRSHEELKSERFSVFSGIGYPAPFEDMVKEIIGEPGNVFRFSDHYDYSRKDIEWMIHENMGGTVLTTEKDWFKAVDLFPEGVEVYAVRVKMVIEGVEELIGDRYGL